MKRTVLFIDLYNSIRSHRNYMYRTKTKYRLNTVELLSNTVIISLLPEIYGGHKVMPVKFDDESDT